MTVRRRFFPLALVSLAVLAELSVGSSAKASPHVTYQPYIQPGDVKPQEWSDQIIVTWQTEPRRLLGEFWNRSIDQFESSGSRPRR
jgi:hypothetical protein